MSSRSSPAWSTFRTMGAAVWIWVILGTTVADAYTGGPVRVEFMNLQPGAESLYNSPRIRQTVKIGAPGRQRLVELESYCHSSIHIDGVYRIPGRNERVVVLTHTGRLYGCEEVEVPLLIPPP